MYTITRGPSKLATQRRTGPTQQIESKLGEPKCRQQAASAALSSKSSLSSSCSTPSSIPKLVFNRVNGRRYQPFSQQPAAKEDSYTPAHEENVRFVFDAWQQVAEQLDDGHPPKNGCRPVEYVEKSSSASLKNFVPIDLEEWWAQRFLANIENCS
ncbi:MAPK regulated corepressor interacting protein 2 [Ambystoma mexicanum]|uniref:MAPK regulated corepressor interacting protein 2 n=1 Tax=Ambystoma mexicanum TaxID=8296 RepID=UPI0037E928E8